MRSSRPSHHLAFIGLLTCAGCNSGPSAAGPTAGNPATVAQADSGDRATQRSDPNATQTSAGAAGNQARVSNSPMGRAGEAARDERAGSPAKAGASASQPASALAGRTAQAGQSGQAGQAGQAQAGRAGDHAPTGNGFQCPAGPFAAPIPEGAAAVRVEGLPPQDAFNGMGNTRTNVEGPVWIAGKLYVSEFEFQPTPSSRILALDPVTGEVSIALASGPSNGLAVDMSGALIITDHKQGAVARMRFPLGSAEVITGSFEGKRFNSPNDLALRSDGTLYFSDPDYQAPSMKPQAKTRVYQLAAGATGEPRVIDDNRSQPNGVTLSADERTLYVAGSDGILRYPVNADGSVMPGTGTRLNAWNGGADGMGMDCAGNLYVTAGQRIVVVSPDDKELGSIAVSGAESVTNVAFGGAEHKTLFITSMGSGAQRGVFRVELNVPGFPY